MSLSWRETSFYFAFILCLIFLFMHSFFTAHLYLSSSSWHIFCLIISFSVSVFKYDATWPVSQSACVDLFDCCCGHVLMFTQRRDKQTAGNPFCRQRRMCITSFNYSRYLGLISEFLRCHPNSALHAESGPVFLCTLRIYLLNTACKYLMGCLWIWLRLTLLFLCQSLAFSICVFYFSFPYSQCLSGNILQPQCPIFM